MMIQPLKKLTLSGLTIVFAIMISTTVLAEPAVNVPMAPDAKVFAQFDDKLPAVVNYYSREAEQALIEFYTAIYGEPVNRERKRSRLSLVFQNESNAIRVIISQQNNMRQVDVIVTEN